MRTTCASYASIRKRTVQLRVSLEWLSEYVEIDASPEELAELLSMSGTEVERVHRTGAGVEGVVTGRVVEVRSHPNADNLLLAMVEDGTVVRQVVCGAPNLAAGLKVALALPGARLPAVSSKELRRATIRGVESDGMLVSAAELGISEDASGILEMDPGTPVGVDIHDVLPLEDAVLELEITPNRPDCMSMVGVAREVSALTGSRLRIPSVELKETGEPAGKLARVVIEDPHNCPRYTAKLVTEVRIGNSPPWMQRRLVASGVRPINNIVDVTNYVMMELGQPLHAFDLELLRGSTVVVRLARHGEVLTTLDGVDRQLDDRSLLICDAERPVALAGIMGGEDSEVTPATSSVLIESACFDPTSILLTSKRLGIRTEASARFERSTDPGGTSFAARRAAQLMVELGGGRAAAGEIDQYPLPVSPVSIKLRPERVGRILGSGIARREMVAVLESLQMEVEEFEDIKVTVPTFRVDLHREIDLIEEIARIHGYDRIPSELPGGGGMEGGLSGEQKARRTLADSLVAQGLYEICNYSFMRGEDLDLLKLPAGDELRKAVELVNPLAETGELMRTTLLPGMLRTATFNINRGNRDLALFELGRVFSLTGRGQLPREVEKLGLLMAGARNARNWAESERKADFFDLKGVVEGCGAALGVPMEFEASTLPFLAPGRSARVMAPGLEVGWVGQVHPETATHFGLEGEIYAGELDAESLVRMASEKRLYQPVGRYPNVKVDIAVVVDESVPQRLVEADLEKSGGALLKSVRLFDVYTGPQIPSGKKSLAYALEFGSAAGTLTDGEAHARLELMVKSLEERFEARLRTREDLGSGGA